jgi:hypothetical protein
LGAVLSLQAAVVAESLVHPETVVSADLGIGLDELHQHLTTGTTPDVASRVDGVVRSVKVKSAMLQAAAAKILDWDYSKDLSEHLRIGADLVKQTFGLKCWLEAQPAVNLRTPLPGFENLDILDIAVQVCAQSEDVVLKFWSTAVGAGNSLVEKVSNSCVPESVIHNRAMLKDDKIRKIVRENAGNPELVHLVKACKEARAALLKVHRMSPRAFSGQTTIDEALKCASHRKIFGTDMPKDGTKINDFARGILNDLKTYGCQLPDFMLSFVNDLLKASSDGAQSQIAAVSEVVVAAPLADEATDLKANEAEASADAQPKEAEVKAAAAKSKKQSPLAFLAKAKAVAKEPAKRAGRAAKAR